jgi:hypothetical protein
MLDLLGHLPIGGDAAVTADADVWAERGPAKEESERARR